MTSISSNNDGVTVAHLYQTHQSLIFAHLLRLVRDPETAEDLCQETFIRALNCWGQHDQSLSVGAWLYRIATNIAYDHLRRRRRVHFTVLDGESPMACYDGEFATQLEQRTAVGQALSQIPEVYRLPLLLYCYMGRSTEEIALILGCSLITVRTRLYRARMHFRRVYRE